VTIFINFIYLQSQLLTQDGASSEHNCSSVIGRDESSRVDVSDLQLDQSSLLVGKSTSQVNHSSESLCTNCHEEKNVDDWLFEIDSTSSGSSTNDEESSCSVSSELLETSSSIDIDDFLGPPTPAGCSHLMTYKLVGDNIDKNVRPRDMRSDHQTRSLHYFHTYAVRDRVDISHYSDKTSLLDVSTIQLDNLLPLTYDQQSLLQNFEILIGRTLCKYIPFFN